MTQDTTIQLMGTSVEVPPEQDVDYVEALVGEGKKYKTIQELARGKINADLHIKTLEEKLDAQRSSDAALEEVLKEIRSTPTASEKVAPTTVAPAPTPPKAVNPADIAEIVNQTLDKKQQERLAKETREKSFGKMREAYGSVDNGLRKLAAAIKAKPHLEQVFNMLGDTDPDAFIKLALAEAPASVEPAVNTPGITDKPSAEAIVSAANSGQLTWSMARKVKKENPKLYSSPEFKRKLEAAVAKAAAEGKDFFTT